MSKVVCCKAVLDANVLHPASTRSITLRAGNAKLYTPILTEDILSEVHGSVRRELIQKGNPEDVAEEKVKRITKAIREQFGDFFTEEHKEFISSMPNHPKDRHVLAAAVATGADFIVTENLRDFEEHLLAPLEVRAIPTDEFLTFLYHFDPENREPIQTLLKQQAAALNNPPRTLSYILEKLEIQAPNFVREVRKDLGMDDAPPRHQSIQI
jgi:hypothetical protein